MSVNILFFFWTSPLREIVIKGPCHRIKCLGPQELYERCCACVSGCVVNFLNLSPIGQNSSPFPLPLPLRGWQHKKIYQVHSVLLLVKRSAPILPSSSRRHKLEGYPTAEPVYSKLSYGRDRDQGHQQPSRGWTSQHHGIH